MRYVIPLLLCLVASPAWASPANGPFSFPTGNQSTLPYATTARPQSLLPTYNTQTQQQNTQTQQQQGNQPGGVIIPQNPAIPLSPQIPGTSSTTTQPASTQVPTPVPAQIPNTAPAQNVLPGSHQQATGGAGGAGGASGQGSDIGGLTNIVGKIFSNSRDIAEQNKRKAKEKEKEKRMQEELQKKIEHMEQNNYRSETLPDAIYKKQYEQGNRHLPKAVYESDYDWLLFAGVESGDSEALRSIIMYGRSLEVRNHDGDTPLLLAALIGNVDAARILLEHGADVDAQNLKNGVTALQIGAFAGSEKLTRLLLEMDADPGIKNSYGKTALQLAEAKSNYGVALLILARSSELAFSGGQEEIKRLHRRQEDKRERELRAQGKISAPNPAAGIVKEIAAQVPPAAQPNPEEKKPLLPTENEESVKDRIQRFLENLAGREKDQEKQAAEKKQKENQRAENFEQKTPPPMPPLPQLQPPLLPQPVPSEVKPAPAPTTALALNVPNVPETSAIIFKRLMPAAAKFFIPDSLFSEAMETEIKPHPPIAPAVVEKLPGEDETLPSSPPKIDLSEAINSLAEQGLGAPEDHATPTSVSPVISQRKPDSVALPPTNNSTSPGLPLRSNGSVPPPSGITPLQPMSAGKNNVIIPSQPGITAPVTPPLPSPGKP